MKTANADDWNIQPLPEQFTTLKLDILLNEQQSNAVRRGFIPDEMEEKWFCYFDNNTLYQHRSWTGVCIDEVTFVLENKQLRAISAKVNRDSTQYTNIDDAEDIKRIKEIFDSLYR